MDIECFIRTFRFERKGRAEANSDASNMGSRMLSLGDTSPYQIAGLESGKGLGARFVSNREAVFVQSCPLPFAMAHGCDL